jgi:putative transposase
MDTITEVDFTSKALAERWGRVPTDFWGDMQKQTLIAVKRLLETTMEIQVQDLVGGPHWSHNPARPDYRNGHYTRDLLTSMGWIKDIAVPRVRRSNPCLRVIPRYRQRSPDMDKAILEMFLSGVSTRRTKEVIAPLTGGRAVSAGTVSNITRELSRLVAAFHARRLSDDYSYLFLDGVYINARSPRKKMRRCVLVAYGIKTNGVRELIDFELAPQGESEAAWLRFLNRLYHRGLEGKVLQLIVSDGGKGLRSAAATVYPMSRSQLCWAHKLRNVAGCLPVRLRDECVNGARNIYGAESKAQAMRIFKTWANCWDDAAPKAVHCVEKDIESLLEFLDCPAAMHKKLRTTNMIERIFREVRRRTRPIGCFTNTQSLERIIFAVFHRQNKLWENMPLSEITQNH